MLDASQIRQILPHRPPFLFVDRVTELDPGVRIVAERDLLPEEPYFEGHFPGRPIMPGVLVSEALAQASGLLMGISMDKMDPSSEIKAPPVFYLASVNIKFISPSKPGQTLRLESVLRKQYARLSMFDVAAWADGRATAKGTLTLAWGEEDI